MKRSVYAVFLALAATSAMAQGPLPQGFSRGGQVFITWRELPDAKEGYLISRREGDKWIEVARVAQGSGVDFIAAKMAARQKHTELAHGFVIQPGGSPLPEGTGLWIHTAAKPGTVSYRIEAIGGPEVGRVDVEERPGTPQPILESIKVLDKNRVLRTYIHWATPEMSHIDGHPFKFAIQTEPGFRASAHLPLFVSLHGLGGAYGAMAHEPNAICLSLDDFTQGLLAPGHDWWFGYSSNLNDIEHSTIVNYTERRMLYTIHWAMKQFQVDENRVYLRGGSMGGTGTINLGFRHPELFAALESVVPRINPNIGIRRAHMAQIWGKQEWNLTTSDGKKVWDRQNLTLLAENTHTDLPFLKNISGKNDGTIEWEQVPPFLRALQSSRLGFAGFWGTGGHGDSGKGAPAEFTRFSIRRFKKNESYPAISNLSVNSNPGNGDSKDGDPAGMMNAGFDWEIVADTSTRWEIKLAPVDALVKNATLDLTPRRLQKLTVREGATYSYSNRDAKTGEELQRGTIRPDHWKLLTMEGLKVSPNGNRIIVEAR